MEKAVSRPAYVRRWNSPLGTVAVLSDGEAVTGLYFEGQRSLPAEAAKAVRQSDLSVFDGALRWLEAYFGGAPLPDLPPLRPQGTAFQQEVWRHLMQIPYGKTVSYGEIARTLAHRRGIETMSARAVGSAVGRNPILLMIPCHRVMGADGSLTGYAGGLERKRALLALEGHAPLR